MTPRCANTRFASHLNAELYQELRKLYVGAPDRLQFSYLLMPKRWRESGSFGTHWMLQERVRIRTGPEGAKPTYTILDGNEMVNVIRALHSGRNIEALEADACSIMTHSRDDQAYYAHWSALLKALGQKTPLPTCVAK